MQPGPYVTAADLRLIMEVPPAVSDASLTAFIVDVDVVVQELLVSPSPPLVAPNPPLSLGRITAIEKYMAAHAALLLTERGGLVSSRLSDAGDSYPNYLTRSNQDRNGLQTTRYGQLAITMDTSGTLLRMSLQTLPAKFKTISPAVGTGGHLDWPNQDIWWLFV